MIVSVFRKAHFNAAHRLHNPNLSEQENKSLFGLCNNPNYHGHNYMLYFNVTVKIDPVTGYLIDTKILKYIIQKEVHDRFDHRNLNVDTEEFKHLNPTAENIAVVIWKLIKPHLNPELDLALRLYETENNFVEFNG
jgi:6-pyruvoyltetrahydropterin/6-carboxytetrahydropterin synthase